MDRWLHHVGNVDCGGDVTVVTSHQFGASSAAEDVSLLDPWRPRTLLSMDVSLKEGSLATY